MYSYASSKTCIRNRDYFTTVPHNYSSINLKRELLNQTIKELCGVKRVHFKTVLPFLSLNTITSLPSCLYL